MKPLLYQIPKSINEPVRVLKECHPYFYDNLHFHSEYQIMTILKGKGTYFIGDSYGSFNAGDSFILGANLPHFFRSSQEYYASSNELESQNISILYSPEALGEKFKDLSELHPINKFLEKSKNGLLVTGKAKEKLLKSSQKITHKNGFERLIYLFKMFDFLSKTDELITLSHIAYENNMKVGDTEKINKVIDFLIDNYTKEITLADAADVANLSVNAFCRYFKKHTRKTFSQFLNEIRIGNACRQLVEEDLSVKEAAFKSGYYNISYFNRQFKNITGCTPSTYCKNINYKHLT